MTDFICFKCNSKIQTKPWGKTHIEVKCRCPHEADYVRTDNDDDSIKKFLIQFNLYDPDNPPEEPQKTLEHELPSKLSVDNLDDNDAHKNPEETSWRDWEENPPIDETKMETPSDYEPSDEYEPKHEHEHEYQNEPDYEDEQEDEHEDEHEESYDNEDASWREDIQERISNNEEALEKLREYRQEIEDDREGGLYENMHDMYEADRTDDKISDKEDRINELNELLDEDEDEDEDEENY